MNGAMEHAMGKKEERPQTGMPSVMIARRIRDKEPASETIRRDECEVRYCTGGNIVASIAFAFRAIGEDGRKMFEKRRTPSVEEMIKPSANSEADFNYAMAFAAEIGFDKIVAYARTPIQENAREAMEAMEKCAQEYQNAPVAGKYFLKEHLIITAMMVARQHFKERHMGNYPERAAAAIDKVRSKEMDPYYAEDLRKIIKHTPKEIF